MPEALRLKFRVILRLKAAATSVMRSVAATDVVHVIFN
jgi:hypothetical protein